MIRVESFAANEDRMETKTPRSELQIDGGPGAIRGTRHKVAGLVAWQKLGLTDREILERHPDLSQNDLDLAWSYYAGHQAEVDQAIRADEDA